MGFWAPILVATHCYWIGQLFLGLLEDKEYIFFFHCFYTFTVSILSEQVAVTYCPLSLLTSFGLSPQGTIHLILSTRTLMFLLWSVWVVWNSLFRCCLKMESWALYSLSSCWLIIVCLCSVTLQVSFAKYIILGLHFLSLSLLNMFLYFILEKNIENCWKPT